MIFQLLMSVAASAADSGHGGHDGPIAIPFSSLFVQALNLSFLLTLLFVLLRKTVKAHFQHRASEYKELVERADVARKEAERSHREMKERLQKLESGAEAGLARVKQESEDMKKRMIEDAKLIAYKLEQEAQRSVQIEMEKAKGELRAELLASALATSSESLKNKLGSSEQKKLQNEFVEKIQVVGG